MNRDLICIICPRGCMLHVEEQNGELCVSGNACPRGKQYAIDECTNPLRTITSIVRVSNRDDTMVSVKTANPIPKGKIFDAMAQIRAVSVEAPVKIGDVILKDVFGADIVATKDVE